MDFSELFGLLGILSESLTIISKNRKTIALIAAISILIRSSIFVFATFSVEPLVKNLLGQETINLFASVGTPAFSNLLDETENDITFFLVIECIMILASATVTLFSVGSTILVSAETYCGKRLSFQDLVPKLAKSFMKQVVTSFHITISTIGYLFCFTVMVFVPILLSFYYQRKVLPYVYAILGVGLISITYLSIVWTLAMVITMTEENCFGIEALGKAARLIKGGKIKGFALNFILVLATLIIQILTKGRGKTSVSIQLIVGSFTIFFNFMVLMFLYVSYTVLYFECKKCHGEEIELQGEWEYSKVALATEDFP